MYHRITCLQLLLWSQQIDWSNIHSIISFVGSTNSCQYHRNRLTLPLAVPRGTASCGPRRTIMCPEARDHAPKGNIPSESSRFPIWVEWLSQLSRVVISNESSVFLSVISFLWLLSSSATTRHSSNAFGSALAVPSFCGTNKLCVLLRSLRDLSKSMPSTPSACSVTLLYDFV